MNKADSVIRIFFFIAGFPFLYYVFTGQRPDWLYFTSLSMIFLGLLYNLFSDWRKGKQEQVKKRLKIYGIVFLIGGFLALMLR